MNKTNSIIINALQEEIKNKENEINVLKSHINYLLEQDNNE